MSEETNNPENPDRDDETMARLLRLSGGRSPISSDIESRVYKRVESEWRASSVQPESSRVYDRVHSAWKKPERVNGLPPWAMPLAIAASVLVAIAVIIQPTPELSSIVPVGTVTKVSGSEGAAGLPGVGRKVYPGERLLTGAGEGISVTLASAESLRIDENSELLVQAADRFKLLEGRVYADTGNFMYRDRHLTIETQFGEISDIGTQFSVAVADDSLEVAVREGRVDLKRGASAVTAVAGERMRLTGDSVEPQMQRVDAHDQSWAWTSLLAPEFDIENKSLLDFLRWAARETGRELVFEDQELRMAAMRTDLHGSVSNFAPIEAVESVLATTSFKYRIERDRIIIQR